MLTGLRMSFIGLYFLKTQEYYFRFFLKIFSFLDPNTPETCWSCSAIIQKLQGIPFKLTRKPRQSLPLILHNLKTVRFVCLCTRVFVLEISHSDSGSSNCCQLKNCQSLWTSGSSFTFLPLFFTAGPDWQGVVFIALSRWVLFAACCACCARKSTHVTQTLTCGKTRERRQNNTRKLRFFFVCFLSKTQDFWDQSRESVGS